MKGKNMLGVVAVAAVLAIGTPACTGRKAASGDSSEKPLTERQKDSLLGTLPVPGAGAVGKALEAADAARSRALQHDTIH